MTFRPIRTNRFRKIIVDQILLDRANQDINLSRRAVNKLALAAGDHLELDEIYLDAGNRDIRLYRILADVLGLGAGDSLALDTLLFDVANRDVNLYRAAANVLKTDDELDVADKIKVDTINELTAAAGTTINGVLLRLNWAAMDNLYLDKANKDVSLTRSAANKLALGNGDDFIAGAAAGCNLGDATNYWNNIYANQLFADTITELTAAAGVTVDGLLIKDGLADGVDVSALKPHEVNNLTYHNAGARGLSSQGLVLWLPFDGDALDYCYDAQTEILTEDGWIPFKDVSYGDKIATLDSNGFIEYQNPTYVHKEHYRGKMVKFKGQRYDVVCTPETRLLVSFSHDKRSRKFRFVPASALALRVLNGGDFLLRKGGAKWKGNEVKCFSPPKVKGSKKQGTFQPRNLENIPTDLWLQFFAWWITEGSAEITSQNSERVSISQTKDKTKINEIKTIIEKLGFSPYYDKGRGFEFNSKQLYHYLKQFGKAKSKFIPKWMKKLPPKHLKTLIQIMIKGDGYILKNGTPYYNTSSKQLAADFQEIAIKSGYGGNISYRNGLYGIALTSREFLWVKRSKPQIIDYDGMVYDVTVPNHVICIRRNGKHVWSGNSGHGNNGTLHGGVSYVDGRFGQGAEFNGTDGYVDVGDISALKPANVCGGCWFKVDSVTGVYWIMGVGRNYNPCRGYNLYVSNGVLEVIIGDGSTGAVALCSYNILADVWYRAIFTYEVGVGLKLYVNGVLVDSDTGFVGNIVYATASFQVGKQSEWTYYFDGLIDEAFILNRIWDADEVKADYLTRLYACKEAVDLNVFSPCAPHVPLITRLDRYAFVYPDGNYIVLRAKTGQAEAHTASWLTLKEYGPYGTFEWKAKIENPGALKDIFVGGFEDHHGWVFEGAAFFYNNGGTYKTFSSVGGNSEATDLEGQDWTTEKTFRIEWSAGQIVFKVNGATVATHNTHIPDMAMPLFCEVTTGAEAAGATPYCYFRKNSFKKIS